MNNKLTLGVLAVLVVVGGVFVFNRYSGDASLAGAGAFDQYGYNTKARVFNGTGSSWCVAGGLPSNCLGGYSPDKLVMKWTADWDRGNDENWSNPPYDGAWTDNEWNGNGVKDGSGAVWHYKIKWYGPCTDGETLPDGGYCVWGQFDTVMDQGVDPSFGPLHTWVSKATPNGYGRK